MHGYVHGNECKIKYDRLIFSPRIKKICDSVMLNSLCFKDLGIMLLQTNY